MVDRETTGEALGVTVAVSHQAICPPLVEESSLLQDTQDEDLNVLDVARRMELTCSALLKPVLSRERRY
jgi:hypothetical protein